MNKCVKKYLRVTLCLLCGSLCYNYTELRREGTEKHRGKIATVIYL